MSHIIRLWSYRPSVAVVLGNGLALQRDLNKINLKVLEQIQLEQVKMVKQKRKQY